MRRWKPQRSWRLGAAAVLLILTVGAAVYLVMQLGAALARPPETWKVDATLFVRYLGLLALLSLAGVLVYRIAAALSLVYTLDRNGLYIHWLGNRAVVPLGQIERIEVGLSRSRSPWIGLGFIRASLRLPEGRVVHCFSTVPLHRSLIIHTASESYAISPQDTDGFVQDLEQRQRLGAIQHLTPGIEAGRVFAYAFWRDPLARGGVIGAFFVNLALLGALTTLYPYLPEMLGLRTDAFGETAALAPRYQIFTLPLAGAAILFLNLGLGLWLYRREPLGARTLQLASAMVQVLFVVAALTVLR